MEVKRLTTEPALLGEGPLWHPEEQTIYWVDIIKPALHCLNIKTNQQQTWVMPMEIGSIGLRAKGGLIAAMRTGFATIDLPSGQVQMLDFCLPDDLTMFNDGKCDRAGRFWAGTKDLAEVAGIGSIYCLDQQGICHHVLDGFTVTNGIAWSVDNALMYACNSPARIIYQYDFDLATGKLGKPHIFARIPEEAGYPDGLTVDSEGCLWSAHWDGWRITRYLSNGKIDGVIEMPVQRPTSVCFGGPDLTTLYVTSAKCRLSAAELSQGPLAGCLFAIEVGVKGLLEPHYVR